MSIVTTDSPRKSTQDLALDYCALNPGRFIFPIKPGAKFPPLVQDNLDGNASNDPEQIKRWHAKWFGCNWGVAHRKSRLLVVDVDTNKAKGKVGQQTYDLRDLEYGWPDTEITTTPSGGHHHIYEGDHIFALGERGIGKDIDSPNYTLIPGCTFDDGTSYIGNGKVAVPCPQWIYDLIRRAKVRIADAGEAVVDLDQPEMVKWAIDFLRNDAPPAIEGQGGEHTTLKVAMSLRDNGISETLAVELMNDIYNVTGLCEPEWSIEELTVKVHNAYTYANLSKVGGKTAEADFGDDDAKQVAASIRTFGTPDAINKQKAKVKARIRRKAEDPKKPWNTQCAVIVSPPSFVDIASKKMLSSKAFNHRYGAEGGAEAYNRAIQSKSIARYDGVCYRPSGADVVEIGGRDCFNMYHPQQIEPLDGTPQMFLWHLKYLIPDPASREHLINWLSWLVQHPDQKMMHAVLLLGRKRTGKSWFAELLKVLLGSANCSEPSKRRVASDFNGWLAYRQLIIIHELREKGARGLYDELKELITQGTVGINLKGVESFEVGNFANFFTISNHEDALPIDDQEGRYLVIRCADEPAFGKGTSRSKEYYKRLFACVGSPDEPGDEARRVLNLLLTRDLSNWDGKGSSYDGRGTAPETEAKADMVEASRSSLEKFLLWALETGERPFSCSIINPKDVLNALPLDIEAASRNVRAVEMALREIGARPLSKYKAIHTSTGRKRLWAVKGATVPHLYATKTHREIAAIYDEGLAYQATAKEFSAPMDVNADEDPTIDEKEFASVD
jgi:hypothetical protein